MPSCCHSYLTHMRADNPIFSAEEVAERTVLTPLGQTFCLLLPVQDVTQHVSVAPLIFGHLLRKLSKDLWEKEGYSPRLTWRPSVTC